MIPQEADTCNKSPLRHHRRKSAMHNPGFRWATWSRTFGKPFLVFRQTLLVHTSESQNWLPHTGKIVRLRECVIEIGPTPLDIWTNWGTFWAEETITILTKPFDCCRQSCITKRAYRLPLWQAKQHLRRSHKNKVVFKRHLDVFRHESQYMPGKTLKTANSITVTVCIQHVVRMLSVRSNELTYCPSGYNDVWTQSRPTHLSVISA